MGFFLKVKNSIINPKVYVEFVKESAGRAVLYIFLITLILGSIGRIKTVYEFAKLRDTAKDAINKDVRDFKFENGRLAVDGDMPITIKEEDGTVIIIDTSGSTTESALDEYNKGMLITDTKFINKKNSSQKEQVEFSSYKDFSFDKSDVLKIIDKSKVLNVFIVIFGVLWFFGKQFLFALFTALLALIVNAVVKARVNFGEVYKLTLYSLTVPIIVNTIYDVSGISGIGVWARWIIYWAIALTYLGFAFKAIKESEIEGLDFE